MRIMGLYYLQDNSSLQLWLVWHPVYSGGCSIRHLILEFGQSMLESLTSALKMFLKVAKMAVNILHLMGPMYCRQEVFL